MHLFLWVSAAVIFGKILYVGTAILCRGEDPRFAGAKIIYRS